MHRRRLFLISGLICVLMLPSFIVMAAASPTVDLDVPNTAQLGQRFTFTATFDNTGNDIGYGPFIDLWLPASGADGNDGITFVSAEYLASPVDIEFQGRFPGGGCLNHPYLRDTAANPIPVCGTPGDQLVVLELPFGSVTPDQPVIEVEITANISPNADIGSALTIAARGGFRFGQTALDDPCCDAPIVGGRSSQPITPIFMTITKTNNAPENEIPTGPNSPFEWTLEADIPAGETVNNLRIIDTLPDSVRFDGLVASNPAATVNQNNNVITFNFGTVTGTAATDDASVTFTFHAEQLTTGGGNVLNPNNGNEREAYNNAEAIARWTPNDPRDGGTEINVRAEVECPSTTCPGGAAPILMSLAVQKSVLPVPSNAPIQPGTTLQYALDFQVSDVYAFNDIVLTDIFSDGQRLVPGSVNLSFSQHGGGPVVGLAPANLTVDEYFTGGAPGSGGTLPNGVFPGDTRVTVRISDEVGDPIIGACVPVAGVAALNSDYCAAFDAGAPTIGTVTYQTVIQENFTDAHLLPGNSGDPSVDQGDLLNNRAVIAGQLVSPQNFSPGGFQIEDDDTEEELEIERGEPQKGIIAINGTNCAPNCAAQEIGPGDTVTYLIEHAMPNSDFESFALIDYLPLPVFDVSEFGGDIVRNQIDATIPPAGTAKLYQGDTLYALMGNPANTPTLVTNAQNNTLRFDYGSFDALGNPPSQIAIAFTVTVQAAPFADGLNLTNLVRAREGSTNSGGNRDDAIVQIRITRPQLAMKKGIVATSNTSGQFLPTPPGPVSFNPPGSGTPFNGTISSNGLANTPVNSDLTNVGIGDIVSFAIVIDNQGQSTNGAFDIRVRDTIAPGFGIPGGAPGLNLQVRLGNGAPVNYVSLPGGTNNPRDLFGVGIELIDPGVGVCGPYDGDDGTNIVIITYDLVIEQITSDTLQNTATVTNYSNREGGGDLTGDGDLTDTASVRFGGGGGGDTGIIAKSVDKPFAKAGERVTWTVDVRNTGSDTLNDVVIIDTLPEGVTPVSATATLGSVTLEGQTYTLRLESLAPGETVSLRIVTDIALKLTPPYVLINTARIYAGGVQIGQSSAQVVMAEGLAATGESAWTPLRPAVLMMVLALCASVVVMFRARYLPARRM